VHHWTIDKKQFILDSLIQNQTKFSKKELSQALDDGRLLINQCPVKWRRTLVFPGDRICLKPSLVSEGPQIVFEHKYYYILSKPAGVISSLENQPGSLAQWAQNYPIAGLVHRLDAQTSGLLVLPKTNLALTSWTKLFEAQQIKKTYLAFANGLWDKGKVICRKPIARHPSHPREFTTLTSFRAKSAETIFEPIDTSYSANMSFMKCQPQTGRTHQIRLHLCAEGTPILGDQLYGTNFPHEFNQKSLRHCLHAYQLEFQCPFDGKHRIIRDPLPKDLDHLFQKVFNLELFR
jgi:RluA family pseudouridine synthase